MTSTRNGAKPCVALCTSARYEPGVTLRKTKVLSVDSGAECVVPRAVSVACVEAGRDAGFGICAEAGTAKMIVVADVVAGEEKRRRRRVCRARLRLKPPGFVDSISFFFFFLFSLSLSKFWYVCRGG